jgi:formylglycine-generating enzyme
MTKAFAVAAALALLCLGTIAQADVFNLGPGFTNLETVAVGDPGNTGELSGAGAGGSGPDRICGGVGYNYNIGKYEVTAGQYTAFLNAVAATDTYGLYNTDMDTAVYSYGCNIKRTGTSGNYSYSVASDWANRPVNLASYWDSCRFANWLGNGQPTGLQDASTTERGAYTLDGYNGQDGRTIGRNTGAKWAVTSEDEWYKAAYYKGGGTNAGYWGYPTQSNTAPANQVLSTDPGNSANYYINNYSIGSPYYRTNVGEFENSGSAYGTFDQGGNVWEWNEAIVYQDATYAYRGMRGGSCRYYWSYSLEAWLRYWDDFPSNEGSSMGFRVVQLPEPSSMIALLGGLVSLLGMRRRRR